MSEGALSLCRLWQRVAEREPFLSRGGDQRKEGQSETKHAHTHGQRGMTDRKRGGKKNREGGKYEGKVERDWGAAKIHNKQPWSYG